jgi:hypothetical protein
MRAEEILAEDRNDAEFNDVKVRKGTVGELVHNVRVINASALIEAQKTASSKDIARTLIHHGQSRVDGPKPM